MSDQRPSPGPAGAWAPFEEPTPPTWDPSGSPMHASPPHTAPPGYGPPMAYGTPPSQPRGPAAPRSPRSHLPTILAVVGILIGIGFIAKIGLSMLDDDDDVPTFRPPSTVATAEVPGTEAPSSPPPSEPPPAVITFGWVPLSAPAGGNTVGWSMPEPNQIDGPRPANGVQANVTYWIDGGTSRPIRHDVAVLTDVEPGLGADEAVGVVIRAVQNDAVVLGNPSLVDGRITVSFSGPYDGRMYLGKAYSWNGAVVLVSVAYFEASDKAQAEAELATMEQSLTFGPP